jgi:hypothetical protein
MLMLLTPINQQVTHANTCSTNRTNRTCKHQLNFKWRVTLAVVVVVVPACPALLCACSIAECERCAQRLALRASFEACQGAGITGWRLQTYAGTE